MTYRQDPVYRTVQWLRARNHPDSFASAFADAWSRWARIRPRDVKVRLGLINYKPFERARVMADVTFVPGRPGSAVITQNLFLHVFADAEAARREFEASRGQDLVGCYGPPVFLLGARHAVGWTLPNAPNLSELKELLDPESFKRLQSRSPDLALEGSSGDTPRLVRYVPLKRAILTWNGPASAKRYYFKIIDGPAAAAAALNLRELDARARHGELSFTVPQLVHYSPDLHTIVMSEVPGRRFTAVMREARPDPFADVGRALASLHRLPTVPVTVLPFDKEFADLRRHSEGIKRTLPKLSARLDAVLKRLSQPPLVRVASSAPIHGNLFGDQILYEDAAKAMRVGIVDWDAWALGDRHFDLGRLIAHFLYIARTEGLPETAVAACIQALLESYQAGAGAVDSRMLEWHVATTLLARAKISSVRKLRPGWPRHVELTLAAAERILDGGGFATEARRRISRTAGIEVSEAAAP
jgi:aminoglycoside phosphotransferase (APT) family kinase protein